MEIFFQTLEKRLKKLDRKKDYEEYLKVVKENAREVREKILKYLMVRRTRSEITAYFAEDLQGQGLKFPEVADPNPIFYELNDHEDQIFHKTIEWVTKKFKYARYTPMLYFKGEITHPEELAQKNMGKFMKILLVKRLESSFHAFKNTLQRFIRSYEHFLTEFEKGRVYVSKKYIHKIFELLDNDNDEAIQRLIEEDKAVEYKAGDFKKEFKKDLEHDLRLLKELSRLWETMIRDPKILKFIDHLNSEQILKENKIIIFTESKETAEYLEEELKNKFGDTPSGCHRQFKHRDPSKGH